MKWIFSMKYDSLTVTFWFAFSEDPASITGEWFGWTSSFCGVIKQPRKEIVRQHCQECRDSRNCNRACTHARVRKKTTMMINIDSCNNTRTIFMQSREFSPFASVSKRNETKPLRTWNIYYRKSAFLSLTSGVQLWQVRQCLGLTWFHLSLSSRRFLTTASISSLLFQSWS